MLTFLGNYRPIKYPSKTQVEVWFMKRNEIIGAEIAKHKNVTPAFVSKTLKEANKRIKILLEGTAKANKISLDLINEKIGFARGRSHMFELTAYITFSPENGVQVWYDHKGECSSCNEFSRCRKTILLELKERNIKINNPSLRPTDLGEYLFRKLEEMVV